MFVIWNVIRILEDPAHVAARLTRHPTSTHEGRIFLSLVYVFYVFYLLPVNMSGMISSYQGCLSIVYCFVDCVGEVSVPSVSPSHIKWQEDPECSVQQ